MSAPTDFSGTGNPDRDMRLQESSRWTWPALRNRLLSSPRFQRWASAFPLTRPIARRRARALFDLCAGFVYSQVLLACVQLRVFEILADGPRSADALADRISLPREATDRLLRAAVSLRLLERRRDGRFGLGDLGAAMLGNPGVTAMIEHHAMLYRDLTDPVALLRGEVGETALGRFWSYAGDDPTAPLDDSQVAGYSDLMSASQAFIAEDVMAAYRLSRHRCLLDVGGGDGTFLAAVARRVPNLKLVLFDLPAVAARAQQRFTEMGIGDRATAIGGDFLVDPLPSGADIISLVRVIHDHDDDSALAILRAVHRALPSDGVLLLAEPMSETAGAEPIGDAYFGFYLLAMGSGRPRPPGRLAELLGAAGFGSPRWLATRRPLLTRALLARPLT